MSYVPNARTAPIFHNKLFQEDCDSEVTTSSTKQVPSHSEDREFFF